MMITSAGANKMLRKLDDDKQYLLAQEGAAATYVISDGVEAIIPFYDYQKTAQTLSEIEEKIRKVKHALNVFNCTTILEGLGITIDEALVKMAQLNQRKSTLDSMRRCLEKERVTNFGHSNLVEYICINYNLEEIQADYQVIAQQVVELQLALDLTNQTIRFALEL